MADKQTDDNIFDEGEYEDDGTADIIRKAYDAAMEDDGEDDGGFDQPAQPGRDDPDVVSPDQGRELLDKSEIAKSRGKNPDESAKPAPKPEADAKSDDAGEAAKAETEDANAPDLSAADTASLLEGVPDASKAEISRRIDTAARILDQFKEHQDELKAHGTSEEQAINRLLYLNSFAQTKPDEYLAWVAGQANAAEPHAALEGAAKLLGYKLTKDGGADDDDDMFLDDTTRALREEVASLKAQIAGKAPSFGPDTPERQQQLTAQRQLSDFVSERDEAGQPRRPFFDHLRPRIVEMALSHRNSTGQHVTTDDLQRFYDQALEEARSAFGNPTPNPNASGNSAAQAAKPVADQIKERAAAAQKAQRASKSIDGTGQGASRRPALSESASLDEVIRHFASQEE